MTRCETSCNAMSSVILCVVIATRSFTVGFGDPHLHDVVFLPSGLRTAAASATSAASFTSSATSTRLGRLGWKAARAGRCCSFPLRLTACCCPASTERFHVERISMPTPRTIRGHRRITTLTVIGVINITKASPTSAYKWRHLPNAIKVKVKRLKSVTRVLGIDAKLFCSALLTPQHYHWYAALRIRLSRIDSHLHGLENLALRGSRH